MTRRGPVLLNWAAHVLLALGLFGPCMTVTPRMEPHTGLAAWLGLLKEPETYSILTGILQLLRGGNALIGIALLVFSVLFPVAKLVVLRVSLTREPAARRLVAALGKYSMVDVFVIALIVIAAKTFPGGTTVDVRWGAYAFGAAALLSIPTAAALKPAAAAPKRN